MRIDESRKVSARQVAVLFALLMLLVGGSAIAYREYLLRREIDLNDKRAQEVAVRESEWRRNDQEGSKDPNVETGHDNVDQSPQTAMMTKITKNLRSLLARRFNPTNADANVAISLLQDLGSQQSSLSELAQTRSPEERQKIQLFLSQTLPQLRAEAVHVLTQSFLAKVRSFSLDSQDASISSGSASLYSSQPYDVDNLRHAIGSDGKWIVRTQVETNEDKLELIDAVQGITIRKLTLPRHRKRGYSREGERLGLTPEITQDNQLLLAWIVIKDAEKGMNLHIETRSIPDLQVLQEQIFDLVSALSLYEDASDSPRRQMVYNISRPVITFGSDGSQIGIMHQTGFSHEGFGPKPAIVLSLNEDAKARCFFRDGFIPVLVSPSCKWVCALTKSTNSPLESHDQIHVCDPQTNEVHQSITIPNNARGLTAWTMSPDDQWLATVARSSIHVCHLPSQSWTELPYSPDAGGAHIEVFPRSSIGKIAFHPKGNHMALLSTWECKLYDLPTFRLICSQSLDKWLPAIDVKFYGTNKVALFNPPWWQFWNYSLGGNALVDSVVLKESGVVALSGDSGEFMIMSHADAFSAVDLEHAEWQQVAGLNLPRSSVDRSQIPNTVHSNYQDWSPELVSIPLPVWSNASSWWINAAYPGGFFGDNQSHVSWSDRTNFDDQGRYFQVSKLPSVSSAKIDCTNGDVRIVPSDKFSLAPGARLLFWQDNLMGIVQQWMDNYQKQEIIVYDIGADAIHSRFLVDGSKLHFHPERKLVLAAGDQKVSVYQMPEGKFLYGIDGQLAEETNTGFRPLPPIHGDRFVVSNRSQSIAFGPRHSLIDISTGKVVYERDVDTSNSTLQLHCGSGDSKQHAWIENKWIEDVTNPSSLTEAFFLTLWDDAKGERPATRLSNLVHGRNMLESRFLRHAPTLIAIGNGPTSPLSSDPKGFELWNAESGIRIASSEERQGSLIYYLDCSEGDAIALGFQEVAKDGIESRRLDILDANTGRLRGSFPNTTSVGTLRNFKYVLGVDQDNRVKVIGVDDGQLHFEASGLLESFVEYGDVFATSTENELQVWHADDQRHIDLPLRRADRKWFGANGSILVSEDHVTGVLTIWDTHSGNKVQTLDPRGEQSLPGNPLGPGAQVQVCPQGKTIAVLRSQQLRLYEIASGELIAELPRLKHDQPIHAIAVDGNHQWLATGGGDRTVGIWDTKSGKYAAMLNGYQKQLVNVAFADDGSLVTRDESGLIACWRILIDSNDQVKPKLVWQRTGAPQTKEHAAMLVCQDRLVCGSEQGNVIFYRLDDGSETEQIRVAPEEVTVNSLAFQKSTQSIAVSCSNNRVYLLDALTKHVSSDWDTEQRILVKVVFDPLNDRVFTLGDDIRYWDVRSQHLLQSFECVGKAPHTLNIRSDGRWLITTGSIGVGNTLIRKIDLKEISDQLDRIGLPWESSLGGSANARP